MVQLSCGKLDIGSAAKAVVPIAAMTAASA
jgi:hypothetical protein